MISNLTTCRCKVLLGPKFTDWDAVGARVNSRRRQAARRFAKLKADGATADAVKELTALAVELHDRLWKLAFPPEPPRSEPQVAPQSARFALLFM